MLKFEAITEFLFGTSSAPHRDPAVHQTVDHRHWDRDIRSWVEHPATYEERDEAA